MKPIQYSMVVFFLLVWDQPSANGNISLPDLETVKVLGKGAGGVVQLVRHKWTNETYALKVITPSLPFCTLQLPTLTMLQAQHLRLNPAVIEGPLYHNSKSLNLSAYIPYFSITSKSRKVSFTTN